jgi:hypothetical protein
LSEIEEAMEMMPEEYLTYFEDIIFVADEESGQKEPFADASGGESGLRPGSGFSCLTEKGQVDLMS